jgi:hypothetical protein
MALLSTCFHSGFFFAYNFTLKTEATYFSETSVDFNGLLGVIFQKTDLFIFQFASSVRVFRLNFVRIYSLSHTCCVRSSLGFFAQIMSGEGLIMYWFLGMFAFFDIVKHPQNTPTNTDIRGNVKHFILNIKCSSSPF